MSKKNSITELIRDIQHEAEKYCKELTEDTDSYIKRETEKAYRKAHADIKTFKKNEIDRLNEETNAAYSVIEADEKKSILEFRSSLTQELFAAVEKNLMMFSESDEYPAFLIKTIEDMISVTGEGTEIILRTADKKYEPMLSTRFNNISYSEKIRLGGCMGINRKTSLAADNTIDGKFDEEKENFLCKKELSLTLHSQGDETSEQ